MLELHFVVDDRFLENDIGRSDFSLDKHLLVERRTHTYFRVGTELLKLPYELMDELGRARLPLNVSFAVDFVSVFGDVAK